MTDKQMPGLPFSSYNGGRFSYLLGEPFAQEIWAYLTDANNLSLMLQTAEQGMPPLRALLGQIETRFGASIASDQFPGDDVGVMINNMIKQIMEFAGYEHVACGMLLQARYIKLSGVYAKRSSTIPAED